MLPRVIRRTEAKSSLQQNVSTNVQRSISAIAERASYHARSGIGLAALAFFAAIAVALFRITEWNGVAGRMLWAEDGHVFIRGAIEGAGVR